MTAVIFGRRNSGEKLEMNLCHHCHSVLPASASAANATTMGANALAYCCNACRLLSESGWIETSKAESMSAEAAVFDNEEVRRRYDFSQTWGQRRYRFYVEGLQCSSCVHLIENIPSYLPEVQSARLNFAQSELFVQCDPSLSLGRLVQFLSFMGYPAHPLEISERSDAHHIKEDRALLRRLAVAGACAGNIMLFTVPIYAGLEGFWAEVFNALSFGLFLPVLLYSALPIYRGAWNALQHRQLNVDVLLTLAFVTTFLASTYNWLRGSPAIYFDSGAGFLFLILVSRWFLKNSQRRWMQGSLSHKKYFNEFSQLVENDLSRLIRTEDLRVGDNFSIKSTEVLAVDSVLASASATFDPSWMTGEATAVVLGRGMKVPAGYRLVSDLATLTAETTLKDSELMNSLRRIENQSLTESPRLNDFDRAAQVLILGVLVLSALLLTAGPAFFGITLEQSFERALSLLIVACPCALAFGGPLAYAMALRLAAAKGLLVKSPDVLDRVNECDTLAFDKTGTLTEGQFQLISQTPAEVPTWMKDLILAFEKDSVHPVAFAFRQLWRARVGSDLNLEDIHHSTQAALAYQSFGIFDRQLYSLQSSSSQTGGVHVELHQEGARIATFEFDDRLRNEAPAILQRLARRFKLVILSGDRQDRVQALVARLQIPGLVGVGECSPGDKATHLIGKKALMIGDGANDAEAFSVAHVGIAVSGSLEQGLRSASVYFLRPGLSPLLDLIKTARLARRLIRRNLFFALIYNLAAGCAAVLGFINPLMAALLMPLSSVLILVSTQLGSREQKMSEASS